MHFSFLQHHQNAFQFPTAAAATTTHHHHHKQQQQQQQKSLNPLSPELNPICYLLAILGAHHFLHINRIRVKSLTLWLLTS
jgi:transposase